MQQQKLTPILCDAVATVLAGIKLILRRQNFPLLEILLGNPISKQINQSERGEAFQIVNSNPILHIKDVYLGSSQCSSADYPPN